MLDSLSWHIMDATADDWESLEQILPHIHEFHNSIEPSVVAEVVAHLVREGLMEEMRHRTVEPASVVADPIEFWFRMTPRGRAIWGAEGGRFRGDEG
jgi:hypothetical protein